MAIHFLQVNIIQRSKQQSALAKSAYITRGVHFDEFSGQTYDFRHRGNALFSQILIPAWSPPLLINNSQSDQKLWAWVERFEKRHDAQLAREYVMALPHELPLDQLMELASKFIMDNFVNKGMVASYAIHAPNPGSDTRNIHMHIMVTMRPIGPEGFLNKERQWNHKKFLFEVRKNWMECANNYLELNLCKERIEYSRLKTKGWYQDSVLGMRDVAHLSALFVADRSTGNHQRPPQKITDFISTTLQHYHHSETMVTDESLTGEKRYWIQQHETIKRKISIENIQRDISRGRVLRAEDIYNLGKSEHEEIKRRGLEYLSSLINQKEFQRTICRER